jgi:hypothetical protein
MKLIAICPNITIKIAGNINKTNDIRTFTETS